MTDEVLFLCINLERSRDRRGNMEVAAERAGFPIRFVPAIDGGQIGLDTARGYARNERLRHAPDLKPNEIACVLSHRRALETFLSSQTKFAVVLEDDALLSANFLPFIQEVTALQIPWHAINLENRNKKQLWPAIKRFDCGVGLYASATLSSGAAAWLYSREGAELVFRSFDCFRHAIDTHLGFFWRHRITALCAYPSLVTQDQSAVSTHPGGPRTFRESELSYLQFVNWRRERIEHSIRKRVAASVTLFRMKLTQAPQSK